MAKVRANWYEKHGISKRRYQELVWFARGYDEYGADDRRRSETGWKVAAIERAAMIAAPEYCRELLKNVTGDMSWEVIQPPCGRVQFYAARRRFFAALDEICENR